ncbi:efflux RND transporter periplasmic adaptor subunit [Azoarcus sp. L1K30]|uniref:efflux RND transporter periplasmic adaptor subunit n=1 Tax=Azoarcus sp. L1K30 TaxID=2820277 RepID=UPI001B8104DD|nr:efflux RND transporter periplasmic adaptor subunit [Azoarcus sp. L1K30]MBR0567997.1 efflux RND transporter periplasmic adaptor subunit [Azoarcus sp. L1K30]
MNSLRTRLAAALLPLIAACSPPAAEEQVTPAVLVHTVGEQADTASLQAYTGEIRARYETGLAFRIGGKVVSRLVDAGTQVIPGQVLARLDPQDAKLAATAANSQIAAAEAEATLARAELKRTEALLARNFVSAAALDSRRTAVDAAEAHLRQARAQAASAANQTGYTELLADSAGIITEVQVEAGEVVAAGQTVMRLAPPGDRELQIFVPESRIQDIHVGQELAVRLWIEQNKSLRGVVREVSPAADSATRTYGVRISLPDGDTLPLGATATAAFAGARADTVVLPMTAVTHRGGAALVWVVDGESRVRTAAVDVLAFEAQGAVVRNTLPRDSRIVVTGVQLLTEGMLVRPVEQGSTPALDVQR